MNVLNRCRWNILPPGFNPDLSTSGYPALICQLLSNRGISSPAELDLFFAADYRLSGDPYLLPDMHPAISRIYRALLSGEKITVYGDFDVDGITGTALLVQGLTEMGASVSPFIPHRITEGYGLKTSALEDLRTQGTTLVITVDCGITGNTEVKKAKKFGMDVIVTDHHLPHEELPAAVAVINPRRQDSNYPFPELAGVGVAFKLLQALRTSLGKKGEPDSYLDLVALGTVADMVPLTGENRYLVKEGLARLNSAPRTGIKEMLGLNKLEPGNLCAENIAWVIAPRLNTPGRLDHALPSYTLLTTDSVEEAARISHHLELKNSERQRLTVKAVERAREQVQAVEVAPLLVVGDDEIPAGIAGLVANRLVEEFYRPTIVIKTGDTFCSGSCRSIPEFNIEQALGRCHHLLTRFGGHARAAGFTLPARNLEPFIASLLDQARMGLEGVDLRTRIDIDAVTSLSEAVSIFPLLQKLAPFGQGNPVPVFLSRKIQAADCRTMGNNGDHLRLKLKEDRTIIDGIGFGLGKLCPGTNSLIDVVYSLELDRWNGTERLRANLLDFAPAL